MDTAQRERVLASCLLFSSLDAGGLALLARASTATTVPQGRVVLRKGETSRVLHVIGDGTIKLYLSSPAGKEFCVGVAGRGMPVDVLGLVDDQGSLMHAVATETTTLLSLTRASLDSVSVADYRRDPMLHSLAAQLHQLTAVLEDVVLHTLEIRVARLLRRLHASSSINPSSRLHRLDQTTIANMVNGTRPKVNVALQKLRRLGAIEIHSGRIVIRSVDLLPCQGLPSTQGRVCSPGHCTR